MSLPALHRYTNAFRRLHRAQLQGVGAPHKPILLLSVINEIEEGSIRENRIFITADLVARFKDNWSRIVRDERWKADFTLPFYHLKSEGFWHIVAQPGREFVLTSSRSPKSFSGLKEWVQYVRLDEELFQLLMDRVTRTDLRQVLMTTYFPHQAMHRPGYIEIVEAQILHEPAVEYRQLALTFDEEEKEARGAIFKRTVPKIYQYTCCVSRMRIETSINMQMVDACHIVPFAESRDDTIGNGLSLCPNLHRAFDRGLFRIDDDYRMVVSSVFKEGEGAYGIKVFAGKRILLPEEREYYPALENLEKHWRRWEGNFG